MAETNLRGPEGQDTLNDQADQSRLRDGLSTQDNAVPELGSSGSSQTEIKESMDNDRNQELIAETVAKFLRARDVKSSAAMDVVFDQATVIGSGSGAQAAPNVGTMAKSAFGVLEPIMNRFRAQSSRAILRQFSGTVKAGEMLLVIGKPGSGCTTFLKTLANMREEYKDTTGDITYGGRSSDDMTTKYPQDITFCAEDDDHFPTQSVAQTLRFALKARLGSKASSSEIEENVTLLAELFGLKNVVHTKVGNAFLRGVSGGERRRVSLAEALATCASLLCFDNPTGGLDSSTALELIEMLREVTTQSRCATAMSIYQGSNAIVPFFDKVVVINSGRQIFYGKVADAKAYFEELGFGCPSTMTITDFLNSMSADADVRHVQDGRESQVPQTAEDFERAFKASKYYVQALEDVKATKETPKLDPEQKSPNIYELPFYSQVWQCALRQFRLLTTDYNTWGTEAICIIVQSLVLGTLFRNLQQETQSFFMFASSIFFIVLVPALQSMAEFQNTFDQRPLILKHKRYQFNRPGAYAFGLVVTDMVWKIAAISYNIPLYFLAGFQYDAGKFFTYFLTVYIENLALSMFFRSFAVFSPNTHKAVLPVALSFNVFVVYTGLYIPPPNMQVWLSWLRYLNPLYYAFESVMLNEFANLTYRCSPLDLAPAGPGYDDIANQVCAVLGSTPGQGTVSGLSYLQAQYGFEVPDLWRNVGINAAIFIAFAVCTGIGMERLKLPAGRLATVFYKAKPVDFAAFSEKAFDHEKGDVDGATPPVTKQDTRQSHKSQSRVTDKVHTFAWSDICLDIKTKEGDRRLLNDLNGWVRSGSMKALMGVSGAGKTTLLNVLAGRSDLGTRAGSLYLDGQALPKSFGRHMGYVQQQDIHLPTQTIREALQMTARLRQPPEIHIEEKNAYVENVIGWLEMDEYADALIGVPGAGLNLEQRKRVTIGVEMAAMPEILFLDEPTSGLDGQSAVSIVRLLRKLADSGQAIICTIHQPAAELIGTFDELYLLARGGQLVYDGLLGPECRDAIQYFEQNARKCDEGENPAEYFFEVIGAGSRGQVAADWPQIWSQSEVAIRRKEMQHQLLSTTSEKQPHLALSNSDSTYAASYLTQLDTLLHRTWLFYWREPDYATSKLWMNVGNSLLNSLTYLQSPPTMRGAYNLVFSAFTSVIVGPALGLQVGPRFVPLRDIFVHRERASQAYHWSVFVAAAIIIELPYAFITSLVYWLLWYFPVGYTTVSDRVGYSFLMYELFAVFATSLAQLCAAAMPHLGATFAANGFFFMVCNVFAGTLSPLPLTPKGWRWYYYVSPLFYYSDGVTTDLLQDLPISCTTEEVSVFAPPSGQTCAAYAAEFLDTATGYLLNPDSLADCEYCRYRDGQSYYLQYGFDFAKRHRNIGAFIGFIAFNFTFVFIMTYLTKVKKWKKA